MAERPEALSCLPTGLRNVQPLLRSSIPRPTHSALIVATDFPVSRTEDIRLFAKTSGETSLKMWPVAKHLRIRPRPRIRFGKTRLILTQCLLTDFEGISPRLLAYFLSVKTLRLQSANKTNDAFLKIHTCGPTSRNISGILAATTT